MIELDILILETMIDKMKDGQAKSADYANAIKYLYMNGIQNISSDKDELLRAIQDIKIDE